jgi:hypothetical protein
LDDRVLEVQVQWSLRHRHATPRLGVWPRQSQDKKGNHAQGFIKRWHSRPLNEKYRKNTFINS